VTSHEQLFEEYVAELRIAMSRALDWWNSLVSEQGAAGHKDALTQLTVRWPFGPSSHPYVVATYRKYFLACEQLNEAIRKAAATGKTVRFEDADEETWWGNENSPAAETSGEGSISPWVLLIDRLRGSHNDLARFMSGFVFQPVAVDPRTNQFI
jgi:hypothetical protein